MKLEAYCAVAGPKVLGPGVVQQAVNLHIAAAMNQGKFTKANAAAGLSLADVHPDVVAQFVPGKLYTITIEEAPASPAATS